jgi:predicted DNA-binding antitoxin AbrB/MazE fold protein
MNVQAIWENGVLRPMLPVNIKHTQVTIQIPDEEIELQNPCNLAAEVIARAKAMRDKLDAIRNSPLPPDDELPELTEKQLERMAAFELREDR